MRSEHWRGLADVAGRLLVVYATITVLNWFLDRPMVDQSETVRPLAALLPIATQEVAPALSVPTPFVAPTLAPTARPPVQVVRPVVETPTPVGEQLAGSPAQRVALFYRLLDQSDFDYLPELMTESYRKTLGDPKALRSRLDPGHMQLRRNETFVESKTVAGVLVDVLETFGVPKLGANRYVGVWWLASSPTGWLLDKPDLELQGE